MTLAGKELGLDPYLWRNFAPSIGRGGSPLAAVLRIATSDGSAVPDNVRADAAWVVYGDEVWATLVTEQWLRQSGVPHFDVIARDGPEWPVGAQVLVVVRVKQGGGGPWRFLRAPVASIGSAS